MTDEPSPQSPNSIDHKCRDPCGYAGCGINAECKVSQHSAICSCIPDYIGDPFVKCGEWGGMAGGCKVNKVSGIWSEIWSTIYDQLNIIYNLIRFEIIIPSWVTFQLSEPCAPDPFVFSSACASSTSSRPSLFQPFVSEDGRHKNVGKGWENYPPRKVIATCKTCSKIEFAPLASSRMQSDSFARYMSCSISTIFMGSFTI